MMNKHMRMYRLEGINPPISQAFDTSVLRFFDVSISQPFNLLAWFMLVDFAVSFAVVCVTTAAHIPAALVTRIPAAHPLIGISCLQH